VAPEPPESLGQATSAAWEAYWASDVAQVASEVDLPLIRRLFQMYEAYEQALQVVRKATVVKNPRGDMRLNPLADYAFKLSAQILRVEEELGLTPLARQRLGIALAERYRSLDELNRALSDRDDHDRDDASEDPRLAVV
jgi:P27 family predicted phage terminase small subunit